MKYKFLKVPVYPFLLGAYPVLALLLYNLSEVRMTAAIRPVLVTVLAALILFILFRLLYHNWHRAAFATFCFVLLFFTYGHVHNLLGKVVPALPLFPWLLIFWIALSALGLYWAARKKSTFEKTTQILNIVSLGLLIFVLVQVFIYGSPTPANEPVDEFAPVKQLNIPAGETPPDIYYIIVDSYGRSDLLNRAFNYDNSQFLQNLRDMGFFVADCSQSNYNRTDVSMGSSLNLDYLQNLSSAYQPPSQSRRKLWASIDASAVRIMLEEAGYTSLAFTTGFAWSEVDSSDVFLSPGTMGLSLTSFEVLVLRTTPALYLEKLGVVNLTELDGSYFRERTLYIFDSMDDLAHRDEPTFAFIHILPPHPPFVFAPDGSYIDPAPFLNEDDRYTSDSYKRGYRSQVEYISGQLEIAVSTLLAESATPPIIILQGDHAPWLQTGNEKFRILNAYYLPDHADLLYPTISPVNTFRVIFNTYFGTDYELLPDTSYYSPVPNIYEFEEFPNPCLDE